LEQYGKEHKFQSVETADFRRSMERAAGRDLGRFFHDWLERPGNPELTITTEYVPDARQARVLVEQRQAGEVFHFSLRLVLHTSGAALPMLVTREVVEKEVHLRIPLPGRLERIDVDPDQEVLAEIKEAKPRDLWRAQLLESPSIAARSRAVEHFAASKAEEDRGAPGQGVRG
jgi:aminopeptidase N